MGLIDNGTLQRAGVPKRLIAAEVDWANVPVEVTDYIDCLDQTLEDPAGSKGLTIAGPPGSGKSQIAVEVLRNLPEGTEFLWATADAYVRLVFKTMDYAGFLKAGLTQYEEDWQHRDRLLNAMRSRYPALVIDDLGAEHSSVAHFAEGELDRLIRARGDLGLLTVITTNLTEAKLAERYSESLASFLREVSVPVVLTGKDRRAGR